MMRSYVDKQTQYGFAFSLYEEDSNLMWIITYSDGTQQAYSDENPLELIIYWLDRKKRVMRIERVH